MATFNATFQTDGDFAIQFEENENLFSADFENVIEKVPSNYGLITWNGTTLTVS